MFWHPHGGVWKTNVVSKQFEPKPGFDSLSLCRWLLHLVDLIPLVRSETNAWKQ